MMSVSEKFAAFVIVAVIATMLYMCGRKNGIIVAKETICEVRCQDMYPILSGSTPIPSKLIDNNNHSLCICGDKSIGEIELK